MTRTLNIILASLIALAGISARAQNPKARLLIVNSYNESTPWTQTIFNEVMAHGARRGTYVTEVSNLRPTQITDSASYYAAVDRVFAENPEPPDMIIFTGQMSFNLIVRARATWGDVPMTLFGTTDRYREAAYYYDPAYTGHTVHTLTQLHDSIPFTYVESPMYYRQTIDAMVYMNPGMTRMVMASDEVWLNRMLMIQIKDYMRDRYPDIRFFWMTPEAERGDTFARLMLDDDPEMCILFSSWFNDTDSRIGERHIELGNYRMLRQAARPVYALRRPYLAEGAIGGCFPDHDAEMRALNSAIDAMCEGRDMSEVPFYYPSATGIHFTANEVQLEARGYTRKECPPGTRIVNLVDDSGHGPGVPVAVLALLLAVTVGAAIGLWVMLQRSRAEARSTRRRLDDLYATMPGPYALLRMDPDGTVKEVLQHNRSFDESGGVRGLLDLPSTRRLAAKSTVNGTPVSVNAHIAAGDKYRLTTFVPMEGGLLQAYSIDTTESSRQLRRAEGAARCLTTALYVAGIVPWHWDIPSNRVYFSGLNAREGKADGSEASFTAEQFFAHIHPDDVMRLRMAYNELATGKSRTISERLRWITRSRDGSTSTDNAEIRAAVDQVDNMGEPLSFSGSFVRLGNDAMLGTSAAGISGTHSRGGRTAVTVCDPNPRSRIIYTTILAQRYDLTFADSFAQLAEQVAPDNTDAVIIGLPTTPREAFAAARDLHARFPQMIIVAVIPYGWANDRATLADNGFTAFISKPVSAQKLAEVLPPPSAQ